MSLRVLAAGTHSLIVDAGRPRTRGLGVPVGGPADRVSLALGNALVGNPPLAPALEITLSGPTLAADADVGMCVFGAPFRLDRDGDPVRVGHTFTLKAGQTLHIGGTPSGSRAYVCVPGGFRAPRVLDSATAFEPLKAGDLLICESSRLPGRELGESFRSYKLPACGPAAAELDDASQEDARDPQAGGLRLRTLPGAQADWFDDAFYTHTYRVTPASNRMGVRLDGPGLTVPPQELVSEPVIPGTVQITNDGKPIVLGVDGQAIGGYPKIAHVIAADLDALGQLRPGDEVRFQKVTEVAAEGAAARAREVLRKWLRRIALNQES
jgi:antagonist of KipI